MQSQVSGASKRGSGSDEEEEKVGVGSERNITVGIHQLRSFSWDLKKLNFVKFHFDLGF
jgi:hypothetical protein